MRLLVLIASLLLVVAGAILFSPWKIKDITSERLNVFTAPADKRTSELAGKRASEPAEIRTARSSLNSHLYELAVHIIKLPRSGERGALSIFGDRVIVSDRFGALYAVHAENGSAAELPFVVPVQLSHPALAKFEQKTLSVLDIEVIGPEPTARLYASYLEYEADQGCIRVALSSIGISRRADNSPATAIESVGDWKLLYRTKPCIEIKELEQGALFGAGGRIEMLDGKVLLTVGSFALDGLDGAPMVAQDPTKDYGKILQLDPDNGQAEIFTTGHRNPQGLTVRSDGQTLSSEHGPRGGDEINVIVKGENYGWPLVTYGTRVHFRDWPLSHNLGRHEGFTKPLFAFAPSLGVSEIVEIHDSSQFPQWNGDLILATLLGQSLMRIHMEEGRVAYVEPIGVGHRVRDIAVLPNGSLAALADDGPILLIISNNSPVAAAKIGAAAQ